MKTPEGQAVLTPITEAAIFTVVTVNPDSDDVVRGVLTDVSGLIRSVGFRLPEGELTCIVGLGSQIWDRLFGGPRPAGLHRFLELSGTRHAAVSTPGDVLFHIRAHRFDLCFELAQRILDRLVGYVNVVDEVHGFRSFDERDLLGFVDGTENPAGVTALDAVVIGEEDPDFAGGSYVVVQKYLHDLSLWDALPIEEQERAIGRSKLSDIEMADDVKPTNSHVALNTIVDDNGDQMQIVRYNMPFGRVGAGEFGTYFIGYARSPDVIEQMLTNMFIGKPPGNYDRILDFSKAVTGSLFYVPTADFLNDPPGPQTEVPESGSSESEARTEDRSLGIGSLKGASLSGSFSLTAFAGRRRTEEGPLDRRAAGLVGTAPAPEERCEEMTGHRKRHPHRSEDGPAISVGQATALDVAAVAGSLRAGSYNRGLLRAAAELAPAEVALEILDLADLPLFNQDFERSGLPSAVVALRQRVADADALLIATPEYNHTIPGLLGNAIDWLSRRLPTSPLAHKPVAIMGAAGGGGSVRAQAALRVPLAHARAAVLDGPVVALYHVDELATEVGDLSDAEAREGVARLVRALAAAARARAT